MARFTVINHSYKAVDLAIEPWADLETLGPLGTALFEYDEPAHLEFVVVKDGEVAVHIYAENVKVSANDKEKHFQMPGNWTFLRES